jgi:hypothetical protein
LVATNYDRSGEIVSRYFNKVLHVVSALQNELIRPPSLAPPSKIAENLMWLLILRCNVQLYLFYSKISDGWVGCGRAQLSHPENLNFKKIEKLL